MWDKLENALIKTGLDYSRQGSYSDVSEYPKSFFTFWNTGTPNDGFYNNSASVTVWEWSVYYYTNDPASIYSALAEFVGYAKEEGFIVDGNGQDVPSDRPDYLGRMITIKYIEDYKKQEA